VLEHITSAIKNESMEQIYTMKRVSDSEALSRLSNGGATLDTEYVIQVTHEGRKHYLLSGGLAVSDPRDALTFFYRSAMFFSMKFRHAGRNPRGNQPYLATAEVVPLSEAIREFEAREVQL
jgi:hypothetical protein